MAVAKKVEFCDVALVTELANQADILRESASIY
jgi:hypothetical protein